MDTEKILSTLWELANSPLVITAVASAVIWMLNKLYAKKPLWKQFEGTIISGIKLAEKEIPDDTPNKALARLDAALRYAVKVFEEVNKREATIAEVAEIKEGVMITHSELEKADGL